MCGTLPSSAMTFSLSTVSLFPTMSESRIGRYFSTLKQTSATYRTDAFNRGIRDSHSSELVMLTMASRTLLRRYAWRWPKRASLTRMPLR